MEDRITAQFTRPGSDRGAPGARSAHVEGCGTRIRTLTNSSRASRAAVTPSRSASAPKAARPRDRRPPDASPSGTLRTYVRVLDQIGDRGPVGPRLDGEGDRLSLGIGGQHGRLPSTAACGGGGRRIRTAAAGRAICRLAGRDSRSGPAAPRARSVPCRDRSGVGRQQGDGELPRAAARRARRRPLRAPVRLARGAAVLRHRTDRRRVCRGVRVLEADVARRREAWRRRAAADGHPIGRAARRLDASQSRHLKRRLIDEGVKAHRRESCGLDSWRGAPSRMALHHVNGDRNDNRLENLQLLCPQLPQPDRHIRRPQRPRATRDRRAVAGAR